MTDHLHALAMRAKAAEACDAQSAVFASDEYATSQPFSSISERFACGQVKDAILALPLEADHAALLREAARLPEIAALIEFALHVSDGDSADYTDNWNLALAALQPFLALETP